MAMVEAELRADIERPRAEQPALRAADHVLLAALATVRTSVLIRSPGFGGVDQGITVTRSDNTDLAAHRGEVPNGSPRDYHRWPGEGKSQLSGFLSTDARAVLADYVEYERAADATEGPTAVFSLDDGAARS